jgi:perosamine synthetase
VHIYGLPVDIDPILDLAKKYDLKVIEDAAEMHGQTYKGRPCGSFGDVSTFSFYPNKHITTGEGGMVLTNDPALAEASKSIRNLCFNPSKRFVHDRLGWNLRMTNLQAAVGVAQLERLEEFIERKRNMGALYTKYLTGLPDVQLPLTETEYSKNIYWVYGLVLGDRVGMNAEEAMRKLLDRGIGCRPFFCPMNQQPVLREMGLFEGESFNNADLLYRNGFYIPSGMALNEKQIRFVAEMVWEVLG